MFIAYQQQSHYISSQGNYSLVNATGGLVAPNQFYKNIICT